MLTTLQVPYVDTSAGELVWTLEHPQVPALATRTVTLPGAEVELCVLGASHQVVLRRGETELIETVACLPGVEPYLPESAVHPVDGRTYTFRAHVASVTARELRDRVAELSSDDDVFVATFPAAPDAVTALRLDGGTSGVRWQTWHTYPRNRQIVQTSTEVL